MPSGIFATGLNHVRKLRHKVYNKYKLEVKSSTFMRVTVMSKKYDTENYWTVAHI